MLPLGQFTVSQVVDLFDATGRLARSYPATPGRATRNLNLTNLAQGTFIVRTRNAENALAVKVIKQ